MIELLVVIAIIALLVSILMPALAGARQLAKTTGCLMNLKSQGHAFTFFSDEHDQTVPTAFMYPHPEGLGQYLHRPYQELVNGAPDNGFKGYGGQGTAYMNPAKGISYAPQFVCPTVANPAGDNDDPLGNAPNSAYIHYGIGMWTTFYWYDARYGRRVDMRRFDDLKPFLNADIESDVTAANADFVFSRNLFAAGASNGISPARFSLVADNYAYWFLNGTRPGGGVRYRHKDRANALMLDGSARAVWEISAYGWHVLKE